MDRVYERNASPTPPTAPVSLEIGFPSDSGVGTTPGAWWVYMMTEEIYSTIVEAGIVPDGNNPHQLKEAIKAIAKKATASKPLVVNATTATTVIDLSLSDMFVVNISANTLISFINAPTDGTLTEFGIETHNAATGTYALAFPAGTHFAGSQIPARTITPNGKDLWTFYTDDGASFQGSLSIQNF